MKKIALLFALGFGMLAAPEAARAATKPGGLLARYTLGGAGVGMLLGTAAATIPWLTSHQNWDFLTGAGAGVLVGAGAGFIGGVVDLATVSAGDDEGKSESRINVPKEGLFAWSAPGGGGVVLVTRF